MEYAHGDVGTEAKLEGKVLHEKLIPMSKTTLDDIIRGIKRRKIFIATFPIFAKFSELILAGIPDALVFIRKLPVYLIELKTTKGDTSRLWKDQLVQARTYGLILEEMGFDCSRLKLVIVRIQRQGNIPENYKEGFLCSVLSELLHTGQRSTGKTEMSTTHLVDYSREDAIIDVNWAGAYWLSRREPIPTRNAAKCRACEFGQVCSHSLEKNAALLV
jgi:CRISPR/Cas system-associated exonuclease Cas4 (RecB family)